MGRRIWYSLLGGSVYRRVGSERRGVYAAFLAVAVTTAAALAVVTALSTARALTAITAAWSDLPAFSVSRGKLILPQGMQPPVRVAADGAVVLLDSGTPTGNPLGDAPFGLILTGSELLLRAGSVPGAPAGTYRKIPLSALNGFPIDKASLGTLLRDLASAGVWLEAAIEILYAVVRDLVRAAVIAWLGLISARLIGRDPGWPQAWRVGLAAWTLPMLAEVAQIAVPVPGWALWMVACVYAVTGSFFLNPF